MPINNAKKLIEMQWSMLTGFQNTLFSFRIQVSLMLREKKIAVVKSGLIYSRIHSFRHFQISLFKISNFSTEALGAKRFTQIHQFFIEM